MPRQSPTPVRPTPLQPGEVEEALTRLLPSGKIELPRACSMSGRLPCGANRRPDNPPPRRSFGSALPIGGMRFGTNH